VKQYLANSQVREASVRDCFPPSEMKISDSCPDPAKKRSGSGSAILTEGFSKRTGRVSKAVFELFLLTSPFGFFDTGEKQSVGEDPTCATIALLFQYLLSSDARSHIGIERGEDLPSVGGEPADILGPGRNP
jgi:hypothetical protein